MLSPLVGFFARKSPRRKNFSEVSPLLPNKGQDVELAQWFYLEGTGTVAEVTEGEGEAKRTYSKVTFTAANVVNNKGTELRPAKTFTGEEYYEIELVRDDANAVVGAWIKNPAFGDKVTETVTDEASGTTATVVTGHTGFYTMKTDADGAFAFNDDNTAGLLPYVQFDTNDNPVAAGDAAATDDTLAMASYRLTEPNLPEGHVLTVFHNGDKSSSPVWATNADSDAKRDIHRSAMVDGYDTAIVTSYPQFAATDKNGAITGADGKPVEQDDKGLAEKTGFIVTANSSTPAANTPLHLLYGRRGLRRGQPGVQARAREHGSLQGAYLPDHRHRAGRHRIRRQHGSRWRPRR